ncbi:hypothetical protein EDD36DRAFT_469800 [Exophiala viscosa]|uniref:Uncharacterized protein n=2 Tax=Exophiala viscosa TaxID=2486360 RepID=A0AAN6DM91_9EURO|nr:hypothetical protein EDD36DRAFT_469800 [Exophiala viscosa]
MSPWRACARCGFSIFVAHKTIFNSPFVLHLQRLLVETESSVRPNADDMATPSPSQRIAELSPWPLWGFLNPQRWLPEGFPQVPIVVEDIDQPDIYGIYARLSCRCDIDKSVDDAVEDSRDPALERQQRGRVYDPWGDSEYVALPSHQRRRTTCYGQTPYASSRSTSSNEPTDPYELSVEYWHRMGMQAELDIVKEQLERTQASLKTLQDQMVLRELQEGYLENVIQLSSLELEQKIRAELVPQLKAEIKAELEEERRPEPEEEERRRRAQISMYI